MSSNIEWKLHDDLSNSPKINDFWYDLTIGGNIRLSDILSDKSQRDKLKRAIELVKSFEILLEELEGI